MFRIKLERINYQMVIEDKFCDYLADMAKDGWIFIDALGEHLVFQKKDPCNIKYQLEYSVSDYDYEDYLKEIGYKFVKVYKGMFIYKNENVNAPDLHTDDIVRLECAKNLVTKNPLVLFICLSLCFLPFSMILNLYLTMPLTLGSMLKHMNMTVLTVFMACLYLLLLLLTAQSLEVKRVVKRIIDNKEPNYKLLNIISKAISIVLTPFVIFYSVGIICGVLLLYIDISVLIHAVLRFVIIYGGVYALLKIMTKYRVNKKIVGLSCIVVAFTLIAIFPSLEIRKDNEISLPTQKAYMSEYTDYSEYKSTVMNGVWYQYNPEELWNALQYENIRVCVNEFVAKEIMKDDIINNEKETRISNEYIQKLIDEQGSYTPKDDKYNSYKDALANLTSYSHELVEECYYDEHFFIARKDNIVLVSYMQDEDNYIDNVIEHYFK